MREKSPRRRTLGLLLVLAILASVTGSAWAAPCCDWCDNWPDPDRCYRVCINCASAATTLTSTGLVPSFEEVLEAACLAPEETLTPAPQVAAPTSN